MTIGAALQNWFSQFGINAYTTSSVPDKPQMPYLTYEYVTGYLNGGETNCAVNIYYYGESESIPNAKAKQIETELINSGIVRCDGGAFWIKRGSPFCQSIIEPEEPLIKRRLINLSIEFFTE